MNVSEQNSMFDKIVALAARPAALAKAAAGAAIAIAFAGSLSTIAFDKAGPLDDYTNALGEERLREISKLAKEASAKSDELSVKINKSEAAAPLRSSEFGMLQKQLADITARQHRIEQVILTNPAKALEVPMLRRDIDSNAKATTDALASMQHSVDRVYDQNKYVMLTIFASIVLLAISTFLKAGKKTE